MSKRLFIFLFIALLTPLLWLQNHNARLFNPLYGFDGQGHINYVSYIATHHRLPLTHEGWQMYQSPLYYLIGLPLFRLGGISLMQYENIVFYLLFIVFGSWLISRLFDSSRLTWLVSALTLSALPVVNYLVPMISNEFMNDVVVGLTLLLIALLPRIHPSHRLMHLGLILLALILGFYTKYTIFTLGPAYILSLWFTYRHSHSPILQFSSTLIVSLAICLSLSLPLTLRNIYYYHNPLPMAEQFFKVRAEQTPITLAYFTNLQWVFPPDLFLAHHYSFLGGTWNTFWHDGYQTTVPVTDFHKKAFLLSALGFILAPLSLFGYFKLYRNQPQTVFILLTYLATAVVAYVLYYLHLPYPSELKAFFMSGLPVVYTIGIVASFTYDGRLKPYVIGLLLAQLMLLLTYFWIQPWWHMVR